jgi:hypothetical protein
MKKRILLLALLAVVGFLLIVHWVSPRINRLSYDNIREGMSESDVVALLNCRPGTYTTGSIVWSTDAFRVNFAPAQRRSWIGDGGAIVVDFDADGKVDGKWFFEVSGGGFVARIRQWFESFRGPPPDSGSVISTDW